MQETFGEIASISFAFFGEGLEVRIHLHFRHFHGFMMILAGYGILTGILLGFPGGNSCLYRPVYWLL